MSNKIFIVGAAPSYKLLSPTMVQDAEVWAISQMLGYQDFTLKIDLLFEMHNEENFNFKRQVIIDSDIPVFCQRAHDDIPHSLEYPIKEITDLYGDYFTNSISYMIAMAIYQEVDEIHIYGVNMINDSEYGHQKPSCEYFIGLARGMGIKVVIPEESDLLKAVGGLYGYSHAHYNIRATAFKKIEQYQENIKKMEEAINKQMMAIEQNHGAMTALKYILKVL